MSLQKVLKYTKEKQQKAENAERFLRESKLEAKKTKIQAKEAKLEAEKAR